jgi:16S rRNA (uracil1498-N3)-methyltransferase
LQAVLKGASMDAAIRDATMMGAAVIQPVLAAHSDVKASLVMRPATLERWRRVALASTKQCRRAVLPDLQPPRAFAHGVSDSTAGTRLLFVEPGAAIHPRSLRSIPPDPERQAIVILGPEGGWTTLEIDAATEARCIPVTLGPLTIRAESMAVAAIAGVTAAWVP